MAVWDSPYLLEMFRRKAGRPASDAITEAAEYRRIAESQSRVIAQIASIAPAVLYPKVGTSAMPTLTTTDHNVFTFGVHSDTTPIIPIGKTQIYQSLTDIPDTPWRRGVDYLDEGTQIRLPNNRTYDGTLYWRGIDPPTVLDATTDPVLFPVASRELIVIDAVRQFATEFARNPILAGLMQSEWNHAFPQHCLVWKTQFTNGGALGAITGRDLALLSPRVSLS